MDHITIDRAETIRFLDCLIRANQLAQETNNLDIVAMSEELMDLLIDKWLEANR